MAIEMRDFKIQSGQMAAFIEAWRSGVVPLRQSHGFRIAGAWSVPSEDRFVWILEAAGTPTGGGVIRPALPAAIAPPPTPTRARSR